MHQRPNHERVWIFWMMWLIYIYILDIVGIYNFRKQIPPRFLMCFLLGCAGWKFKMPGTHHPQSVLGQPTVLPAVIGKFRKFAFLGSNKKGGTVESQKGCLLDSAEQLSNLKPCLKQVKTWLTSTFYLAMAKAGSTFRFGIFGSCTFGDQILKDQLS